VASGIGTSAIQLARETGCRMIGVDLSPANVAAAAHAAVHVGLSDRVTFVEGDAEALPLVDDSADGALCECALCTFPDKPAAARELVRVLRPGARLALSDVTAHPARLPHELTTVPAWVACIADARPLEEIAALLGTAGFEVESSSRHDEALTALLERIQARLQVLAMAGLVARPRGDTASSLIGRAREAIADGALGYCSIVARRT
jgi:arsenite methyltransferase